MGARRHAVLAAQMADAVDACCERDDWTCHICGIRLRHFMEVDHLAGHQPCGVDDIRTICQFCHQLRHLVWAAQRGRLRLIWAPKSSQILLNIMAWQVLLASPTTTGQLIDEELTEAAKSVVKAAHRRERILADIIGGTHPVGFIEALRSLKRLKGEKAYIKTVKRLDQYVRFWPVATDRVLNISLPRTADLSHWREGDFHAIPSELLADHQRPPLALRRLVHEHQMRKI